MQRFVEYARAHYDMVIIDTPPVLAVSDPLMLSPLVDGVLLVLTGIALCQSLFYLCLSCSLYSIGLWSTNSDHTTWDTAGLLFDPPVTNDDIPAVVAFNTPSDFRIGMLWSNQVAPKHFAWTSHKDGDPETTWNPVPPQQLVSGDDILPPAPVDTADDHLHLTVTPGQDILATTKSDAQNRIHVRIHRHATDAWETPHLVSSSATRPIVQYVQDNDQDNDEVYMFYVTVTPDEKIVYKKALYANLSAIRSCCKN